MDVIFRTVPLLIVLGWLALWLWCLMDIRSYRDETWRTAGESKTVWTLAVLVLQFFGTLFYLLWVRDKLQRAELGTDHNLR